MLRAFIEANRRVFEAIYRHFPQTKSGIFDRFMERVVDLADERPGQTVLDAGAGSRCLYAWKLRRRAQTRLVGVDVSADEMARNPQLDERRVADVTRGIPLDEASVDLVVSLDVLEHLSSVEAFFAETKRVLKPHGRFVHLFACRYAPYAVLERLLPAGSPRRLLEIIRPENAAHSGFRAHYDRCHYGPLLATLARLGLAVTEVKVCYCQSRYYGFLLPLGLLSAVYEWALFTVGAPSLSARMLVVGAKTAG